jgi:DNA polymerase-3 subunit chi
MSAACQVDFYVLARPTQSAGELACRLAMKAWEGGFRVVVRVDDENAARDLDEQMWDYPAGRFLPHGAGADASAAPVAIVTAREQLPAERDLVINLCADAVQGAERFGRLLEIVPADPTARDASRVKYRDYRERGLSPETHTMN